jgi:hypothetical protein
VSNRKKWRLLDTVEGICAVCRRKCCNCSGCIESRGVPDRCFEHREEKSTAPAKS